MSKFVTSARRAIATFLFATLGVITGFNVMSVDVATWQIAVSTGLGAVLNLVYRWSEAVVNERRSTVDDEIVGAAAKDAGAINIGSPLVWVLVVLAILFLLGIRVSVG